MSMSKERKSLQAKLRNKYKWSTTTDYGRGAILGKRNASEHKDRQSGGKYVTDLYFNVSGWATRKKLSGNKDVREIQMTLNKYKEHQGHREYYATLWTSISFEELELIYNIAKAAREEIKEETK